MTETVQPNKRGDGCLEIITWIVFMVLTVCIVIGTMDNFEARIHRIETSLSLQPCKTHWMMTECPK